MYTIYLTNHGYSVFASEDFNEIDTKVKEIGFECYIMRDDEVIAEYSVIGGWRHLNNHY